MFDSEDEEYTVNRSQIKNQKREEKGSPEGRTKPA